MKKKNLLLICVLLFSLKPCMTHAQDPYLGEIRMFAGNFPPKGWMKCEGQVLSINQFPALFSLLSNRYGGDGIRTFALPDLRGRIPIGQGNGPGLTPTFVGDRNGAETVSLTVANLPAHNHTLKVSNGSGTLDSLTENGTASIALVQNPDLSKSAAFTTASPDIALAPATVSATGQGTPVYNMQPSLTITFIIAYLGIFPLRDDY